MILITTMILVDIRITLLIKQHTGHQNPETGEWQTDALTNTVAHAILGGVMAQLQGSNALAGATGAAVGENAADIISHILYPTKAPHELSPDEKEQVSGIASIAGAMTGAIVGGGEGIADAVAGGMASKNAVENNYFAILRIGGLLIKPRKLASGMLTATPEFIASAILAEKAGIDMDKAKEFINGLTPEQMMALNSLGIDVEERSYSPEYQQALLDFYRKNGSQTTIATDPNELPKLEGYPIPNQPNR